MSDKDVNAEEALKFWYDLAKHENPPGMVDGMLGACARGWIKMVRGASGEIAFSVTPEGLKQNEQLLNTPGGQEVLGKLKRSQIERS